MISAYGSENHLSLSKFFALCKLERLTRNYLWGWSGFAIAHIRLNILLGHDLVSLLYHTLRTQCVQSAFSNSSPSYPLRTVKAHLHHQNVDSSTYHPTSILPMTASGTPPPPILHGTTTTKLRPPQPTLTPLSFSSCPCSSEPQIPTRKQLRLSSTPCDRR